MQRSVKCQPYLKFSPRATTTWSVPALCEAYNWPSKLIGGGTIAIVELGGGWVSGDMQTYFSSIRQPLPNITDVSVNGYTNSRQNPQVDADVEVALDIQVAGAAYYAATGKPAKIRVYWANDLSPAVRAAADDGCAVCSISWGADEADWGDVAALDMEAAAKYGTKKGMVTFAAAGDNDSSDGGPNAANVDCPASCYHVISCGGTSKTATSEVVWNNNPNDSNGEGTGGGYSTIFPVQPFQTYAPPAPKGLGRMVPDVSGNADPSTGYEILVYGSQYIVGGTSAVAPLYAGLFAAFGKGTKLGYITPWLWRNQGCFVDIVSGDNGTYKAATGPDPCSGIGVPNASMLAEWL